MKRIEMEWLSYRHLVLPADAPDIQVRECRRAFYAGGEALMRQLVAGFDRKTTEPTDADMRYLDEVAAELKQFAELVGAGAA